MARRRTNEQGFTIIEVLIVLAIAGIILLIVFEAIPALQRNGRNNQRRQDVAAILAAVSHYELNHTGTFPSCSASGTLCFDKTDNNSLLYYTNLTYYDPSAVTVSPLEVIDSNQSNYAFTNYNPVTAPTDIDTVQVYNYEKCSSAPGQAAPQGAGSNDVVALFALENGSGTGSPICEQL